MKNIILIICCFIFCIGCKKKEVTKQEKKITTITPLVKEKEIVVNKTKEVENLPKKNTQIKSDSQICEFISPNKIPFEEKVTSEDIILKNKISLNFYRGSNDSDIKKLLNLIDIVCIGHTRAETFNIYKINYKSKEESIKIYKNLKQIKSEKKYHHFFKRGLVFILEDDSIIMIHFNAFYKDNFKRMKKNLLENKEKYEKVLLSFSMTSIEELVR